MFSLDYLLYAMICVGVFTLYMALMNLLRSDKLGARIQNVAGDDQTTNKLLHANTFVNFCEQVVSRFSVSDKEKKQRAEQVAMAGIQSPNALTYIFFYTRIIQPLLLVLIAVIWVDNLTGEKMTVFVILREVVLSVLIYMAARSGVDIYLRRRRKKRQQIFLRYFPEVLDLLLVCIESGLGLDAALARACKEMDVMHPLIVTELERTRLELTLLPDRVQALENFADRMGVVQFRALVAALIQTERFGTSLVDTLRVLAEDQRVTRLLETENKVARIPALVTIPLILCILPSFIIILIGPPFITIMDGGSSVLPPAQEEEIEEE